MFLTEIIKEMHRKDEDGKPVPFSLTFVTADKNKRTGGEVVDIAAAILTWGDDKAMRKALNEESVSADKKEKKPNHWKHRTRNLLLPNGQIRKVHLSLITKFNGYDVI